MQYQFKQACHLNGKDYHLGVHDVPAETEMHPHFYKYVEAGLIVDLEASKVVSPETTVERSKRLLDRLMAKKPTSQECEDLKVKEEARLAKIEKLKAKAAAEEKTCEPVGEEKETETDKKKKSR